uniref:Uncharacterized protein n=1 Tax=Rangifer tarandus platyrhynchus TaxID=3082113 RepID=A0ACB0EI13_RANTA|nr:unnamed protein product [Rangifer tarandus platyrhynchus]
MAVPHKGEAACCPPSRACSDVEGVLRAPSCSGSGSHAVSVTAVLLMAEVRPTAGGSGETPLQGRKSVVVTAVSTPGSGAHSARAAPSTQRRGPREEASFVIPASTDRVKRQATGPPSASCSPKPSEGSRAQASGGTGPVGAACPRYHLEPALSVMVIRSHFRLTCAREHTSRHAASPGRYAPVRTSQLLPCEDRPSLCAEDAAPLRSPLEPVQACQGSRAAGHAGLTAPVIPGGPHGVPRLPDSPPPGAAPSLGGSGHVLVWPPCLKLGEPAGQGPGTVQGPQSGCRASAEKS